MQGTFLQKVVLCAIIGAATGGVIEWYKVFVTGADDALNSGKKVHFVQPQKH